jgi:hypothetical protein
MTDHGMCEALAETGRAVEVDHDRGVAPGGPELRVAAVAPFVLIDAVRPAMDDEDDGITLPRDAVERLGDEGLDRLVVPALEGQRVRRRHRHSCKLRGTDIGDPAHRTPLRGCDEKLLRAGEAAEREDETAAGHGHAGNAVDRQPLDLAREVVGVEPLAAVIVAARQHAPAVGRPGDLVGPAIHRQSQRADIAGRQVAHAYDRAVAVRSDIGLVHIGKQFAVGRDDRIEMRSRLVRSDLARGRRCVERKLEQAMHRAEIGGDAGRACREDQRLAIGRDGEAGRGAQRPRRHIALEPRHQRHGRLATVQSELEQPVIPAIAIAVVEADIELGVERADRRLRRARHRAVQRRAIRIDAERRHDEAIVGRKLERADIDRHARQLHGGGAIYADPPDLRDTSLVRAAKIERPAIGRPGRHVLFRRCPGQRDMRRGRPILIGEHDVRGDPAEIGRDCAHDIGDPAAVGRDARIRHAIHRRKQPGGHARRHGLRLLRDRRSGRQRGKQEQDHPTTASHQ